MEKTTNYIVEVEKAKEAKDGRPSVGPVYRSIFAKDGFPSPVSGMESCWDIFRYDLSSLEKFCYQLSRNLCFSFEVWLN